MKRGIWLATNIIMFAGFFAYLVLLLTGAAAVQSPAVIVNATAGCISLLFVSVLSLIASLDSTPKDTGTALFYIMLVISYLGVLMVNCSYVMLRYSFPIWAIRLFDGFSFILSAVLSPVFLLYQRVVFSPTKKLHIPPLLLIGTAVDIVFLIVSSAVGWLFTVDETGRMIVGNGYYVALIFPSIVNMSCLVEVFRADIPLRKHIALLIFDLTPVFIGSSELFIPNFSSLYIAIIFDLLLIYGFIQAERSLEAAERSRQLAEQSAMLVEKQTRIMLSQIGPHFIYNTLGSISALCEEDPFLARDLTDRFARYLRVNMNSIKCDTLIPFEDELKHTETYLWIERVRFADRLNIIWDITCRDFRLPALTLQPLAENAVKHGITPLSLGGTVRISTQEDDDYYIIRVEDNGVGFDVDEVGSDGKLHVGLENVRQRLDVMCRGELHVISHPGHGTIAEIHLPKEN